MVETPTAEASAQAEAPPEITVRDLGTAAAMGAMLLLSQLLALLVAAPFEASNIRAFEDPDDPTNPFIYVAIILVFTFILLWLARRGMRWIIQAIILGAVGSTIVYVLWPLLPYPIHALDPSTADRLVTIPLLGTLSLLGWIDLALSLGFAAALTWLLYRYPEWWVVDSVGVLVSAGAIAIFGLSFGPVPAILLLVLLAVYDFIAVYRTRHMLALADSVMDLKLPIMLVVPRSSGYSFLRESSHLSTTGVKQRREAMFMGLGDIVIPSVLIITAWSQMGLHYPAIGALLGTLLGFCLLMWLVLKGRPHAGLPALNGGSILGFLAGLQLETGSVVFW